MSPRLVWPLVLLSGVFLWNFIGNWFLDGSILDSVEGMRRSAVELRRRKDDQDNCLSRVESAADLHLGSDQLISELGCAVVCLLQELYGPHGGMIACLEVREGQVHTPDPGLVDDCLWGQELANDHSSRHVLLANFLNEVVAGDASLRGSVVIELHDHSSIVALRKSTPLNFNFTWALRGLGIPTLTPNCGTYFDPTEEYDPEELRPQAVLRRGSCFASFPVADAHFIERKGYSDLNARVDAASAANPWEKKESVVRWRGSSTGMQHGDFFGDSRPARGQARKLPDPRFNQRVNLAMQALLLLGKEEKEKEEEEEEEEARKKHATASNDTALPTIPVPTAVTAVGSRIDVALTSTVQMSERDARRIEKAGLLKPNLNVDEMMKAKALVDIDGNANSWDGAWWKFRSNSVVLRVESPFAQWYHEGLRAWEHYIPVRPDLSDFAEKVAWSLDPANDEACRLMAVKSTLLIRNITYAKEVERTRKVLKRSFAFGRRGVKGDEIGTSAHGEGEERPRSQSHNQQLAEKQGQPEETQLHPLLASGRMQHEMAARLSCLLRHHARSGRIRGR